MEFARLRGFRGAIQGFLSFGAFKSLFKVREKGANTMADEKEKAIEKDQATIKPAEVKKEDLSEKDLGKVAGGFEYGGFKQEH